MQLKAYPVFLPLKNMFNAFQKFFSFRWNNLQKLLNTLFTRFDFIFLIEGRTHSQLKIFEDYLVPLYTNLIHQLYWVRIS